MKKVNSKKSKTVKKKTMICEQKICAILGWVFPIGLIWYLIDKRMKKGSFVQSHIHQGLVFVATTFVLRFALKFAFVFKDLLFVALDVLVMLIFIVGVFYAVLGREWEIPIVGKFAKHLNF